MIQFVPLAQAEINRIRAALAQNADGAALLQNQRDTSFAGVSDAEIEEDEAMEATINAIRSTPTHYNIVGPSMMEMAEAAQREYDAQEAHRLGQAQWNAYKQVVRRLLVANVIDRADLSSISTDVSTPGRKLLREIEAYGAACAERKVHAALIEAGVTEANA